MINLQNSVQIGYDCTFKLNDFDKPLLTDEGELIKNVILTLLFMKPGQYPSLPHIGLDIQNMLYSTYNDINEEELENRLISQCQILSLYFKRGDVAIKKMRYRDMPSLIIHITTSTTDSYMQRYINYENKRNGTEFFIGISVSELNEMIYNINIR